MSSTGKFQEMEKFLKSVDEISESFLHGTVFVLHSSRSSVRGDFKVRGISKPAADSLLWLIRTNTEKLSLTEGKQ